MDQQRRTMQCQSATEKKLECGPMPNVMADQPNIGGESSVIPFFVARRKFWLMSAAQVPYSNAANIGEGKTWDAK